MYSPCVWLVTLSVVVNVMVASVSVILLVLFFVLSYVLSYYYYYFFDSFRLVLTLLVYNMRSTCFHNTIFLMVSAKLYVSFSSQNPFPTAVSLPDLCDYHSVGIHVYQMWSCHYLVFSCYVMFFFFFDTFLFSWISLFVCVLHSGLFSPWLLTLWQFFDWLPSIKIRLYLHPCVRATFYRCLCALENASYTGERSERIIIY